MMQEQFNPNIERYQIVFEIAWEKAEGDDGGAAGVESLFRAAQGGIEQGMAEIIKAGKEPARKVAYGYVNTRIVAYGYVAQVASTDGLAPVDMEIWLGDEGE